MIYSDEELNRWWAGKTKQDQEEILDRMEELSTYQDFVASIRFQYEEGKPFSPKQLAAIRKWAK